MEQIRINAFFTCLDEMMNNIISVYPDEYALKIVQAGLLTMRSSFDNKEVILNFHNFIKPNYEQIKNKNISFFVSEDISKTIPNNYIILFEQLKNLLQKSTTTEQTKYALFSYIEQLYKISKLISN